MTSKNPDVTVWPDGSITLLTFKSQTARDWVDQNVHTEPYMWLGRSLAVDSNYVKDIITGMIDDGLVVD